MYPPKHHIEIDKEKIYQVIDAFPFASVISKTEDDVIVTHIPLVLNRDKGKHGCLIGHIDKNNPQANHLDDQNVTVVFHGPNTYISPSVYQSAQLPTWNSISVHIKGSVKTSTSSEAVCNSLIKMAEFLETGDKPYVLKKDEPKMHALINYIVGFEIEIKELIGRFKLSQDKSTDDIERATQQLIAQSKIDHSTLINSLLKITDIS